MGEIEEFAEALIDQLSVEISEEKEIAQTVKRIDEENHKKFLENLPKYRQEIDDLPFHKINGKIIVASMMCVARTK